MGATIKQLRAFVAVARTRSFAEACGMVHLSQPALSIAIKKLEEAVGGQLLSRTTRAMALTPEGEAFLPVAERLLMDWDHAMGDLKNRFALRRGKVAVAAMPSFACNQLPRGISRFRDLYPDINITINDVVAENVVDMVRAGRVELGVSFDPGELDDLIFEPLFKDEFVAVLPANHPLAVKKIIRWQELLDEDFILLQRPSSIRLMIEQQMEEQGMLVKTAFETHQLATIGRMVATGLGVSVVPALCSNQMEELGAAYRLLKEPEVARRVGILTRRRYPLSSAARALKEVLVQTFKR